MTLDAYFLTLGRRCYIWFRPSRDLQNAPGLVFVRPTGAELWSNYVQTCRTASSGQIQRIAPPSGHLCSRREHFQWASPAEKANVTSKYGVHSNYGAKKADKRMAWWRARQGFLKIELNGLPVANLGQYNFWGGAPWLSSTRANPSVRYPTALTHQTPPEPQIFWKFDFPWRYAKNGQLCDVRVRMGTLGLSQHRWHGLKVVRHPFKSWYHPNDEL